MKWSDPTPIPDATMARNWKARAEKAEAELERTRLRLGAALSVMPLAAVERYKERCEVLDLPAEE